MGAGYLTGKMWQKVWVAKSLGGKMSVFHGVAQCLGAKCLVEKCLGCRMCWMTKCCWLQNVGCQNVAVIRVSVNPINCTQNMVLHYKLDGVAPLIADPSQCNSINRQNPPLQKNGRPFEPIIQF